VLRICSVLKICRRKGHPQVADDHGGGAAKLHRNKASTALVMRKVCTHSTCMYVISYCPSPAYRHRGKDICCKIVRPRLVMKFESDFIRRSSSYQQGLPPQITVCMGGQDSLVVVTDCGRSPWLNESGMPWEEMLTCPFCSSLAR